MVDAVHHVLKAEPCETASGILLARHTRQNMDSWEKTALSQIAVIVGSDIGMEGTNPVFPWPRIIIVQPKSGSPLTSGQIYILLFS